MIRKYFLVAAMAAFVLATASSCEEKGRKKATNDYEEVEADDEDDDSRRRHAVFPDEDSDSQLADEQHAKDFIKDMYEHQRYNDYDYLKEHCTPKMLEKLSEAYEYDGEGYAVWLFRTSSQDGKPGTEPEEDRILSIDKSDKGVGWFSYEFTDGGWRGKNLIRLVKREGAFKIDDVEREYDEASEAYSLE